jgi:ATP-dependent Lhr-like helicase
LAGSLSGTVSGTVSGIDETWADALASLVKDGRARSVEVRKVNGEPLDGKSPLAAILKRHGFVDSYRGVVVRA